MERIILHIDVNNAFLSWTAVDMLNKGSDIDIRTIPSVICGSKENRTGIVLAKSMPAKRLGIVSAEVLYLAFRKCPNLKTYPPDYELYKRMSDNLFDFLRSFTPDIEIASIDECYMDYGKVKNLYGDEVEFAYKLKNDIRDKFGFTVNIGIANNKLCAKMASDFEKPDRVHTLYMNEVESKMWPLPVSSLFGVGKQTSEKLMKIGIKTIKDLAFCDGNKLSFYFKNTYKDLIDKARGIDDSLVSTFDVVKGISNEVTLKEDVSNKEDLFPYLEFLSLKVSKRIKEEGKYAYVICLILKDNYFRRFNHQKKLKNPVNSSKDIYEVSKQLLNEVWNGNDIRLIGIRLDGLTDICNFQISLFDKNDGKNDKKIDDLLDSINKKYGKSVISKGKF